MRNAELDEAQAGIKIARRNINNLRYANDSTLMAESEEELKSLLKRVKKKSGKTPITSDMQMTPPLWQKARREEEGTKETLDEGERGK